MRDIEALQGTWSVVELEIDGRKMPAGMARIELKGDRFVSTGMGAQYEGTIQVDAKQQPKSLDMVFSAGPEKGNTNFGIFEVDGDTWRLCLDMTGRSRPKAFASGRGVALETLRRVSEAEVKSAQASAAGFHTVAAPELEGEWAMESCTLNGDALPASVAKQGKRVARNNEITVTMGGQVIVKARFTVDRSQSPMGIDYLLAGNQLQHGIYELEGKRLKVIFSAPGQPRPEDFSTAPGDGRTFTVWKQTKS